jgi:hypothetical protein
VINFGERVNFHDGYLPLLRACRSCLPKFAPSHMPPRGYETQGRPGGTKAVGHQMVGSNSARRKQKSKPWADHIFVVVNSRPALANSIGPIAVLRITRVQPAA